MTAIQYRTNLLATDPDTIEAIVRSTGFFYENEIPIARELAEETLIRGTASGYQFVFAHFNNQTLGYAAYGLIDGTDGSYNLYWIAVHASTRGKGIGKGILRQILNELEKANGRQLIAETSSLPIYEPTRGFYLNNGFAVQAIIPDFFRLGDDKLIYVRRIDNQAT